MGGDTNLLISFVSYKLAPTHFELLGHAQGCSSTHIHTCVTDHCLPTLITTDTFSVTKTGLSCQEVGV